MISRLSTTILLAVMLTLAACRAPRPAQPASDIGVTMSLSVAPNPPQVGNATLVLTIMDEDGQPINDAQVNIRGDMNHAGMQPVLRDSSTGREGDYTIPFEWTMGGDWFIVVTADLPDGLTVEEEFEFTVDGEMMMDNIDMATEEMDMPMTEEASGS